MKKTLGSKIRQLRQKQDIKMYQLAKHLDVPTTTLGMWECGKRTPPLEMIDKIAAFFNCSVDYLLDRQEDIKKLDEKQKLLIELIGLLSDEQLEHLTRLLATITADNLDNLTKK